MGLVTAGAAAEGWRKAGRQGRGGSGGGGEDGRQASGARKASTSPRRVWLRTPIPRAAPRIGVLSAHIHFANYGGRPCWKAQQPPPSLAFLSCSSRSHAPAPRAGPRRRPRGGGAAPAPGRGICCPATRRRPPSTGLLARPEGGGRLSATPPPAAGGKRCRGLGHGRGRARTPRAKPRAPGARIGGVGCPMP